MIYVSVRYNRDSQVKCEHRSKLYKKVKVDATITKPVGLHLKLQLPLFSLQMTVC